MPLLTSPIDGSPMKQINRFGIELDVCPTSGGVWLDKGELEKLMTFIKQSAAEEDRYYGGRGRDDDDDDDRYERSDRPRYEERSPSSSYGRPYRDDDHHKGKHKKKGPMHQMMDIFDF